MPKTQLMYRSIDDYLGPGDTRFFGSGFRRAQYDVRDITVRAGEVPEPGSRARISIRYPTDWSTKAERTDLRPHLSTVDMLMLGVQLSEVHLAYAHGLDSAQRRMSWLRKVSIRAGQAPQEDLQRITGSAIPLGTEPVPDADGMRVSTYDCAVGMMQARCEIVHPAGEAASGEAASREVAYRSADEALGPAHSRYYGEGFKSRRQMITDVAVDTNELTASASVRVQSIGEIIVPTEGIEGGFQPSLSLVDAFVTNLQLGQVLLYELDSIPRERSNTLWMVRTVLESDGPRRPYAAPVPTRTTITRKRLLPLRGGTWRNVDFTSECGDVKMRASFAHEIPSQAATEPASSPTTTAGQTT